MFWQIKKREVALRGSHAAKAFVPLSPKGLAESYVFQTRFANGLATRPKGLASASHEVICEAVYHKSTTSFRSPLGQTRHKLSKKSDRGFTLIELVFVLIIIGIIAGIASPNLIRLFRRNQVNEGLSELLGAIRETQRQAMRQGRVCRLDLEPNTNMLTATPPGCLLTTRTIDAGIDIRTNLPGGNPNISFSHKGSTTRMGTIVLSSDSTQHQRCFVISLGLGIMRTGYYRGSSTGSVSASNCQAQ